MYVVGPSFLSLEVAYLYLSIYSSIYLSIYIYKIIKDTTRALIGREVCLHESM